MKKVIILMVTFSLGYLAHFFVSRMGYEKIDVATIIDNPKVEPLSGNDTFVTYVDFDGKNFSVPQVAIKKGDYLALTNTSDNLQMWLVSTVSAMTTVRGYAKGERLQTILDDVGVYIVGEKNSGSKLKVKVD